MALANTPVPPLFQDLHQKNTIYFVENELSGTCYDDDHLKRPRLIIGGKYDGGPTTYYRIDFSGLDGGSKDSFTFGYPPQPPVSLHHQQRLGPARKQPTKRMQPYRKNSDFVTTAIEPWKPA